MPWLSLDSMHKRLQDFHKKFAGLKKFSPQIKKYKDIRTKLLENAGDLFNDLCYIYKDKYNEEKNVLDTKGAKKLNYTKLRLVDNYRIDNYDNYESEEEKQTNKKSDKKEQPKKPEVSDVREFNKLINNKKEDMNRELFKKHLRF